MDTSLLAHPELPGPECSRSELADCEPGLSQTAGLQLASLEGARRWAQVGDAAGGVAVAVPLVARELREGVQHGLQV